MELAPGLHRIGNDIVAAYLVIEPGGITVIDAGLPGHWKDLQAELAALGRPASDIRAVLLTHGDSDHIGFAERLRREHGVPVYVHGADSARARGLQSTRPSWGPMRLGPIVKFMAYGIAKGGMRPVHLTEVREFAAGDVLDLPGAPRIFGLPGHSPGSVAIYVPSVDAVFVGDALTTRHVLTGRSGPQPAPFTDDPPEALASLERLRTIGAQWVLPGHGTPWREGVGKAVDAVVRAAHDAAGSPNA
ncbi:MBL fold metallo-hydrolase [Sinomonas notoginsengisoli]|uniref:MBL fold metallo-hydrolase n=1 Tax=Sinomonas notoginsengisoli TaxID=1457311 RepID=UPI001F27F90F|nr:MBL fold metallo-hydrolase [Sinomonas notoginsengisoli]